MNCSNNIQTGFPDIIERRVKNLVMRKLRTLIKD